MFIKTPITQENCTNTVQKIRSQNVQTIGYVYGTKNGPNRCPVWEIQSFSLIESCMSSFSKTIIGLTIQEILAERDLEIVPNWECFIVKREKYFSFLSMWTI